MPVDEQQAGEIARGVLVQWGESDPDQPQVLVDRVEEHRLAWVVSYGTARFLEFRDPLDTLVGACPLVIDKANGEVHVFGSGPDGYREYRAWLDGPPVDQS